MSHKKRDRNAEICRRLDAGESGYVLAREFGITRQRVYAIFERDRDGRTNHPVDAARVAALVREGVE